MPSKKKNKSRRKKSKIKTRMRTETRNKARSPKKLGKKKAARKKRATRISTRKRSSSNIASRFPAAGVPASPEADFQGLSRTEEADSESVDELVEEGNVFEAGAVAGVEEADNADEKEVHTHEVSEDDVPDEYLEKD